MTEPSPLIKAHPAAELFPRLSEAELEELVKDIYEFGQHQPIFVYKGQMLDGRNRYEACRRLGIEPRVTEYVGNDPVDFVVSMNLKRRHLDESQRALVAGRIANLDSGRPRSGSIAPVSRERAAARSSTSRRRA